MRKCVLTLPETAAANGWGGCDTIFRGRIIYRFLLIAALLFPAAALAQATRPTATDKLATRLSELVVDGLTVTQALTAIAEKPRLNIIANWENLAAAGVKGDHKLRGRLYDVTVKQAITLVLMDAGANESLQVGINNEDDAVLLSGPTPTVTKVYAVGKLQGAFPKPPTTRPDGGAVDPNQPLIDVLLHIDPDTWRDTGGIVGSITFFGQKMVVTHTPAVQAKVEAMLKELEKQDAQ